MTKAWIGIGGLAAGAAAVALGIAAASTSCSQTPQNVPVRSLQGSQNADVVCMNTLDGNGNIIPPVPLPQSECAPVPANIYGPSLPNHLFAVVTQTTRGELAVVDLTAGVVVDEDRSTPGINFIPVGAAPTDVKSTPDGYMTYVATASESKPAIYGIPARRMLGDYGCPSGTACPPGREPLRITDLHACVLPQEPQALAIASRPGGATVLLVLLRGSQTLSTSAAVIAVDPASITPPEGIPDAGSPDAGGTGAEAGAGAGEDAGLIAAGTLAPCRILGVMDLSSALPAAATPGPTWASGVPYADVGAAIEPSPATVCGDAGVPKAGAPDAGGMANAGDAGFPLSFSQLDSPHPTAMVLRNDVPVLYVADEAIPVIHVIDVSDPTAPKEQEPLLATSLLDTRRRVVVGPMALSPPTSDFKRYLYASDSRDNSVMVFDVTDPVGSPHVPLQRPHPELNPFAEPDRISFPGPIATLAFVQNDWPLPAQGPTAPGQPQGMPTQQYTGLLCNPNPNAHPLHADGGAFLDLGAFYRVDEAALIQPGGALASFPTRLRGVFAFVTLSNGTVEVVDVDDWDAPCRRPDPMAAGPVKDLAGNVYGQDGGAGQTGLLDLPQPPPGATADAGEFDPYRTPLAYNDQFPESPAVTLEPFFPVSAPHRLRSDFLLLTNSSTGTHVPNLPAVPALFDVNGAPLATGSASQTRSQMLPTLLPPNWVDYSYLENPLEPNPNVRAFVAPEVANGSCTYPSTLLPAPANASGLAASIPGVRISFDDPTAHQDQSWGVIYEGVLPTTASGLVADLDTTTDTSHQTMILSTTGAQLCLDGIEDADFAKARLAKLQQELASVGLPPGRSDRAQWTGDYVELTDDLLPPGDPYWSPDGGAVQNDCWGQLASASVTARYDACVQAFGTTAGDGGTLNPDLYLARDFPILEAYSDYLKVGRFGWHDKDASGTAVPEQTTNRVIVPASDSNPTFLDFARCCFHNQSGFKVRAGGEWLAVGSATGLLHRVRPDSSSRCVQSTNPRLALFNARAFDIPWTANLPSGMGQMGNGGTTCDPGALQPQPFFRNSPLAMRNPMFSFVMWDGCGAFPGFGDHTLTQRDEVWRFSMSGSTSPVSISLAQGGTTAVSPQSMLFIPSLQQLAVIDGEAQGLILLDLNLVAFSHAYY